MELKFKRLHEKAVLPRHSKHGDAGLDLTVVSITLEGKKERHQYGLAVEIPEGHVGLLFPRSSINKYDVRLSNCVGVIDSGYRGEVMAVFDHTGRGNSYEVDDRSAQLVVVPYASCKTAWSDELSQTERASGGFGHTGN